MSQSSHKQRYFYISIVLIALIATLACNPLAGESDSGGDDFIKATLAAVEADPVEEAAPTDPPEPTTPPEPTEVPATPTPEAPSILVVSEDIQSGHTDFTSIDEISSALDILGYEHDTWSTRGDGYLLGGDLTGYDIVIWSVGDDCCDSPPFDSVEAMKDYMDQGGNLFIEGVSVVSPWNSDPFTSTYLGVTSAGYSVIGDIVVEDSSHPIAAGFPSGSIRVSAGGIEPDTLRATSSTVVFVRGPNSAERDTATITAMESGGYKAVVSNIPVQWLTNAEQQMLLQNIIDWFQS